MKSTNKCDRDFQIVEDAGVSLQMAFVECTIEYCSLNDYADFTQLECKRAQNR